MQRLSKEGIINSIPNLEVKEVRLEEVNDWLKALQSHFSVVLTLFLFHLIAFYLVQLISVYPGL